MFEFARVLEKDFVIPLTEIKGEEGLDRESVKGLVDDMFYNLSPHNFILLTIQRLKYIRNCQSSYNFWTFSTREFNWPTDRTFDEISLIITDVSSF